MLLLPNLTESTRGSLSLLLAPSRGLQRLFIAAANLCSAGTTPFAPPRRSL
jgi:hypothetical protein